MSRAASGTAVVLLSVVVLACGGDNERRSPTEPGPVATAPVTLPGEWAGTMTVRRSSGPETTCNLRLTVDDDGEGGIYSADWTVQCPGESQGGGIAFVVSLPLLFVNIIALESPIALDGCQWASFFPRQGRKLSGDWQKTEGSCPGSTIQGGILDLTKAD